jgi:hypothetical protein
MTMSKYSSIFLLSNAEYKEIGDCLRLRKYGSWLAEESWTRDEQNQKRAKFTLRAIALARKIAQEKGIEENEAFAMLQGGGEGRSVLQEHSEEAISLMTSLPSPREQLGELITIFFKNRGEVLQGKKWTPTEDWSIEDTQMLPRVLLEQVEAFIAEEDKGEDAIEETEEKEEAKN